VVGFRGYLKNAIAPAEAMEVSVTAERWLWTFTYANGTVSVNELHVPRARPVKLILSSRDVIHSFFVPELRVKRDAVPNSYSTLWFEATEVGEATIQCAEYCGTGHSAMLGRLVVQEEKDFNNWLETGGGGDKLPPAELGAKLFVKLACNTCHTTDGTPKTGPTFKGIFGSRVELADGKSVVVDEEYIRESITNPTAKIVRGFQPLMPVFKGLVTQKQIDGLVAFIKEQK
jgi:cytochrome c oxidase subunit 2